MNPGLILALVFAAAPAQAGIVSGGAGVSSVSGQAITPASVVASTITTSVLNAAVATFGAAGGSTTVRGNLTISSGTVAIVGTAAALTCGDTTTGCAVNVVGTTTLNTVSIQGPLTAKSTSTFRGDIGGTSAAGGLGVTGTATLGSTVTFKADIGGVAAAGGLGVTGALTVAGSSLTLTTGAFIQNTKTALLNGGLVRFGDTASSVDLGGGSVGNTGTKTGASNTSIGTDAGRVLTTGNNNVFAGVSAGYNATTAFNSTCVGANSCLGPTIGAREISAFGLSTCGAVTTGVQDTCLGANANVSGAAASNQTAVGYNAITQADNSIMLGNSAVTNVTIAGGSPSGILHASSGTVIFDGTSPTLNLGDGTNAGSLVVRGTSTLTGSVTVGSLAFGNNGGAITTQVTIAGSSLTLTNGAFVQNTKTNTINGGIVRFGDTSGSLDLGDAGVGNVGVKTGTNNTSIGSGAGDVLTIGTANTFVGRNAGGGTLSGINMTFVGEIAGRAATTGNNSSCFGAECGYSITSGLNNTGGGHDSISLVNTGASNSGWGQGSCNTLTSGNENSCFGRNSDSTSATGENRTALGFNALAASDNHVQLGGSAVTSMSLGGANAAGNGFHLSSGTLTVDGTANKIALGDAVTGGTLTLIGTMTVTGSTTLGGGSAIAKVTKTATASTDLGAAITATCTAETNFSITGVAVGDACVVTTPAALAATDWVVCRTLLDNVALKYCSQGATIDPAAMVFHITTIEY